MNAVAKTKPHGPDNEEVLSGLPVGYQEGNQSLAVAIAKAEVDQQITTAHAYPRSVALAVKNILALATLDEETAKECIYALPRGGKPIKGPSIRLAEIIQSQWGNNRVGTRVVHVDRIEKYVEAEGVFHDLETNAATTARVRRRISDRAGQVLNEDMILVTSNAASSIAKRNAILAGVPKAVWRKAYAAVEAVLVGDVSTMAEKRTEALKAFAAFGIKPEQIYEVLEIGGLDDIGPDEYTTLVGMHQAVRSGETTVEEMFPVKKAAQQQGDKPKDIKSKLDNLADGGKPAGQQTNSNSAPSRDHAPETTGAEQPSDSRPVQSEGKAATDLDSGSVAADPIARARQRGAEARANGLARKAVPAEYRADEALRDAYLTGFDEGQG